MPANSGSRVIQVHALRDGLITRMDILTPA
jgi:hypothetical protein